jgi:dethiobiotin synthetase
MARKSFFVAGTDTDAGKTLVASGLLVKAARQGLTTAAVKPVAAGCEETESGLRNSDALMLQQAMTLELPYDQINPLAFKEPIAPHIAAMHEGKTLQANRLAGFCRGTLMQPVDLVLIEGAGGWKVPLNPRETLANVAVELNVPVILVVGMKLGCINHALLTAESIAKDGLKLAGWVANRIDADMSCYEENVMTLKTLIQAPLLGEVPFVSEPTADKVSEYLSVDELL